MMKNNSLKNPPNLAFCTIVLLSCGIDDGDGAL